MAEINLIEAVARGKGKQRAGIGPPTAREQLSKLLSEDHGPVGGEGSDGEGSSTSSESGDKEPWKQCKLHPKDMPWHNQKEESAVSSNPSCTKSANLI